MQHKGVAIANHCAIVDTLRVVNFTTAYSKNLLRHIFLEMTSQG